MIAIFRRLGWAGPVAGGRHAFMVSGKRKQTIPNTDCDRFILRIILRQAGITEQEWEDAS